MSKTLSVSAIQKGTVIDHITPGQTLRIIHLLRLLDKKKKMTVGFNLASKGMKVKDLIKIEDYVLTNAEANDITIFAPDATINIIDNFEVIEKIIAKLPSRIQAVFICPNPTCISNVEPMESIFKIEEHNHRVNLICEFCEKVFYRNQVKVKI